DHARGHDPSAGDELGVLSSNDESIEDVSERSAVVPLRCRGQPELKRTPLASNGEACASPHVGDVVVRLIEYRQLDPRDGRMTEQRMHDGDRNARADRLETTLHDHRRSLADGFLDPLLSLPGEFASVHDPEHT